MIRKHTCTDSRQSCAVPDCPAIARTRCYGCRQVARPVWRTWDDGAVCGQCIARVMLHFYADGSAPKV